MRFSWSGSWNDGSCIRCDALRDHQVRQPHPSSSSPLAPYLSADCVPLPSARTKLIEDSRKAQPQFKGLLHGTSSIIRSEGFAGIYRGLSAVVSRPRLSSFCSVLRSCSALPEAHLPLVSLLLTLLARRCFVKAPTLPFVLRPTRLSSSSSRATVLQARLSREESLSDSEPSLESSLSVSCRFPEIRACSLRPSARLVSSD
jgi:hypothetical protein